MKIKFLQTASLFFTLLLLLTNPQLLNGQVTIKAGIDFPGTQKTSMANRDTDAWDDAKKVRSGFYVGVELTDVIRFIEYGIGIGIHMPRTLSGYDGPFGYFAMYPLLKVNLPSRYLPAFMARGGYNIILTNGKYSNPDNESWNINRAGRFRSGKITNQFFYGFGVGFDLLPDLMVEAVYSNHGIVFTTVSETYTGPLEFDYSVRYQKISLVLGYRIPV